MVLKTAVAKVIFYGYACVHNYENVEFVTNSPTRHETVIDTQSLNLPVRSSYHTILKNGDGYDFIFRNREYSLKGSTCLYNSESNRIINVLEDMYHLNHNFCVIESHDGDYYGIGGMHSRYFLDFCNRHNLKIEKEPLIRYRNAEIVSPKVHSKYHHNGLYLMRSADMLHWEYVQPLPVISGIHPGHTDNFLGYSKFDSKISCFYSNMLQQYILFIRANMGEGRRWVQTTRSKDLVQWEPFELLKMEGVDFDNDNYYHFDAMEYPGTDLFVGLSAYTNRPRYPTKICIKLMFSKDGVHWVDAGSIVDTPTSTDGYRNSVQTTSVFFDKGDYYDMFFNENYDGIASSTKSSTVVNYKIPKDRLVGISSQGLGRFEFEIGVQSDRLILNYACQDNGYIKLTINDCETFILHGDTLNKELAIDKKYMNRNVQIKVEMEESVLYSVQT